MRLTIFPLYDLISEWDALRLSSLLLTFECSIDRDAEEFLKTRSIDHVKKGISRTYLAMEEDDSEAGYAIKGYFTIALKCLYVDDQKNISEAVRVKMNINNDIAQAYILGQLAKSDGTEKGFGQKMIDRSMKIFLKGNEMFGCQIVRLDCKDNLIQYYETYGFTHIGKNQEQTLNPMIYVI